MYILYCRVPAKLEVFSILVLCSSILRPYSSEVAFPLIERSGRQIFALKCDSVAAEIVEKVSVIAGLEWFLFLFSSFCCTFVNTSTVPS